MLSGKVAAAPTDQGGEKETERGGARTREEYRGRRANCRRHLAKTTKNMAKTAAETDRNANANIPALFSLIFSHFRSEPLCSYPYLLYPLSYN